MGVPISVLNGVKMATLNELLLASPVVMQHLQLQTEFLVFINEVSYLSFTLQKPRIVGDLSVSGFQCICLLGPSCL